MADLSTSANRSLWTKTRQKTKPSARAHRKDAVVLPVLTRRPNNYQANDMVDNSRGTSLNALLASRFNDNNQESYSRSQLRAMASSKILSTHNNQWRTHNKVPSKTEFTERVTLAPLKPESAKKTNNQRQFLPETLQAAINEVQAVRTTDRSTSESLDNVNDRGNNNADELDEPTLSSAKLSDGCNVQLPSRRPEWRRYIRRIMLSRSFRGTTLARYRRLVGIVARKNLSIYLADAAEGVVQYRLEFRSAVVIQSMILRYLKHRRRVKQLKMDQTARRIQIIWRGALARERRRQLAEQKRQEESRKVASRAIQNAYSTYRSARLLREQKLREQQKARLLEKARLKLLDKYQTWRQCSKKVFVGQAVPSNSDAIQLEDQGNDANKPVKTIPVQEEIASNDSDTYADSNMSNTLDESLVESPSLSSNVSAVEPIFTGNGDASHTGVAESSCESNVVVPVDPIHVDIAEKEHEAAHGADAAESCESNRVSVNIEECPEPNQVIYEGTHFQDICNALPKSMLLSPKSVEVAEYAPVDESESERDAENSDALSETGEPLQEVAAVEECELRAREITKRIAARKIVRLIQSKVEASRITRAAAAQTIYRLLLQTVEAKRVMRHHAALVIQCQLRSYQAMQQLARARLAELNRLRARLQASWHPPLTQSSSLPIDEQVNSEENDADDLESDLHSSDQTIADGYLHLLPTRNGQVPPGVPTLSSNAGAPLLSLWKWSWPSEKWLSSEQWQLDQQT